MLKLGDKDKDEVLLYLTLTKLANSDDTVSNLL